MRGRALEGRDAGEHLGLQRVVIGIVVGGGHRAHHHLFATGTQE